MNAPGTGVTLYSVTDDYLIALRDLAAREDLPAEVVTDTLDSLKGDLEVKATSVAAFVRNVEDEAALLGARAKELQARSKRAQTVADGLKAYLATQLMRAGVKEAKHGDMRVLLVKNPPAVNITDILSLPAEFMRVPEPPPPPQAEPDKKALSEALKAGLEIPGAQLIQSYRVRID
ncbi:MAG: siphovirus Gp157 family protein [Betaproteobacteria bacterium]|nr:siphovirus Gp157 family protein [Betaproteobacteria bacterium]